MSLERLRVASIDSQCDCCKKTWKAQMKQSGQILHLCSDHANELLHVRGNGKNEANVTKWVNSIGQE